MVRTREQILPELRLWAVRRRRILAPHAYLVLAGMTSSIYEYVG
jgi:hypothetical protein